MQWNCRSSCCRKKREVNARKTQCHTKFWQKRNCPKKNPETQEERVKRKTKTFRIIEKRPSEPQENIVKCLEAKRLNIFVRQRNESLENIQEFHSLTTKHCATYSPTHVNGWILYSRSPMQTVSHQNVYQILITLIDVKHVSK